MSQWSSSCSDATEDEGMGRQGLNMSMIFSTVPLPLASDLESSPTSSETQSAGPKDPSNQSHDEIFCMALHDSGVSTCAWKRRRLSCKRSVDATLAQRLIHHPERVNRRGTCNKSQQTKAFNEFRYWYIRAHGCKWNPGKQKVLPAWRLLKDGQRYHWYLLREIRMACPSLCVAAQHRRRRGPSMGSSNSAVDAVPAGTQDTESQESLYGPGIQLTYFPKLGQDNPIVIDWIRQGLRGDDLRSKLMTLPDYKRYFDQFVEFIQQLCSNLGFATCCCCMEMGDNFRFVGGVHLHAYMSFLKVKGGLANVKTIRIPTELLGFCNLKPFPVVTKGYRGRRLIEAMAQGMHYLLGPKSSAMYQWTTLEPVKDLSSMKHRICSAMFLVNGARSSKPSSRSIVNNFKGLPFP